MSIYAKHMLKFGNVFWPLTGFNFIHKEQGHSVR